MKGGSFMLCLYSLIGLLHSQIITAIKTYKMDEDCGGEITMLDDSIYQGRLTLQLKPAYSGAIDKHGWHRHDDLQFCTVTIEAPDDHLMFYFETFTLPCDIGYLKAFDGRPDFQLEGIPGLENVCGSTVPGSVFTTNTKFLTLFYSNIHAKDAGQAFSLVFTTYRTGSCPGYRHICDNGRCIVKELLCNNFRSCGDGSGCPTAMEPAVVVGVVIGSVIAVCLVVVVVILLSICHRRQMNKVGNEAPPTRHTTAVANPVYGGY